MNELVRVKNNDIFTDSLIIAEGTRNKHRAIKQLIRNYEKEFLELSTFNISNVESQGLRIINLESTGGRPEQIYELNEQQATFLTTLLRNSDTVVKFKLKLVKEFYRMRQFILEKQTAGWQESRKIGKKMRRSETDAIMTKLIPLAESQGSKNAGKLYMVYSKLVNTTLEIEAEQRDILPTAYIDAIRFLEHAIENIISIEADKGTHYKEIYQVCKAKCSIIKDLAFLPAKELISA